MGFRSGLERLDKGSGLLRGSSELASRLEVETKMNELAHPVMTLRVRLSSLILHLAS